MKQMKLTFLLVIILGFSFNAYAQNRILDRLNIEITGNYSTVMNKSQLDSVGGFVGATVVKEESDLSKFNYNFSIGCEISKFYQLRLKYSRFDICRRLSGVEYRGGGGDSWYPENFTDVDTEIQNSSISLINEFHVSIRSFDLLGTVEFVKQKFDRYNSRIYLWGMKDHNYAFSYSFGIQKMITPSIGGILRVISTNTLIGEHENFNNPNQGSFKPVSYGVEIGIRYYVNPAE